MSKFYHFKASEYDKWIDVNEVCIVECPVLMNESRFKWLKGSDYWRVLFVLKSGKYDYMDIWSEELANNYVKILRGAVNV